MQEQVKTILTRSSLTGGFNRHRCCTLTFDMTLGAPGHNLCWRWLGRRPLVVRRSLSYTHRWDPLKPLLGTAANNTNDVTPMFFSIFSRFHIFQWICRVFVYVFDYFFYLLYLLGYSNSFDNTLPFIWLLFNFINKQWFHLMFDERNIKS